MKHFGPGGGSVINVGSVISINAAAPTPWFYAATKVATLIRSRWLCPEVLGPKKIRVNSLNPGGTETEGFQAMGSAGAEMGKWIVANTPMGRIGTPEDIAPVAVFLASDDSQWLSGATLLALGGLR